MSEPVFLRACRGESVAHVPVWFMRQAGRSLPEYRALRGNGSILEAIADPALACEITLQPVRRYGVDAAILFSDIVVPYHAIGFGVDIVPGRGPVIAEPFASAADLARLRDLSDVDVAHVTQTVDLVVKELEASDTPLIGFAGAPFTVASYLVEGGPTREFALVKTLDAPRAATLRPAHGADRRDHRLVSCAPRSRTARARCSSSTPGPGR